ncbi:hypothetical protein THIOKS13330012 [Thiocapsa sp. KS1]|nr:hypothetical protein THIOKS13330012 [Thiocapsa sp. KS1]
MRLPVRPMPHGGGEDADRAVVVVARRRAGVRESMLNRPPRMLRAPLFGSVDPPPVFDKRREPFAAADMLRDTTAAAGLRARQEAPDRAHRALPT